MNRNYITEKSDSAIFFIGHEVEHTPAYGLETLFVVGVQSIDDITSHLTFGQSKINHIFFGQIIVIIHHVVKNMNLGMK